VGLESNRVGPETVVASLRRVTKRFPGIVALQDVSLELHAGETHVLLGENGAGKSTLVSLLAGMQQPEEGEIFVRGRSVRIDSPRRARDLGIGVVYQQLLLVPSLTVLENLMLGGPWWRPLERTVALERFKTLSGLLGTRIDPDVRLAALSLGEQQHVEIIRALWRDESLLLLDEPTSMLTPQGVADLGRILAGLKARGTALVLITHKLPEAFAFGDRISVLRQGRLAGAIEPARLAALSEAERTDTVLALMFGAETEHSAIETSSLGAERERIAAEQKRVAGHPGHTARPLARSEPPVLSLQEVSTGGSRGEMTLKGVSLEIWAGEVLGIAGVDGNGQKHLAEVIVGQRPASAGRIEVGGADVTREHVPERRRAGVRYVTDERLGEGTVGPFSVATNLVLKEIGAAPLWRHGVTDWDRINARAREVIAKHDIRTPSERTPVAKLSGGNIQKVLLARELDAAARVVILNKPTYGLDLKNQQLALERIDAAAARGIALIVISTELDELIELCDRIGVMYQGRLAGMVENGAEAERRIGLLMTGAAA
jgi:general nucleoside transport system ATP-binding protein